MELDAILCDSCEMNMVGHFGTRMKQNVFSELQHCEARRAARRCLYFMASHSVAEGRRGEGEANQSFVVIDC